jgi:two-component system, OmpR family, phosphate regulon response regulator PhoB
MAMGTRYSALAMSRLLVIEDEKDLQKVLEYNLRQAGHEVLAATHGQDGLRLARESHPELILLDLMLPGLAGKDICRLLKDAPETRDIPIIIMTARGEEVDRVLGFELGADDYVVKPFSVRELLLRIQAILRRQQGPGEGATAASFGILRIDREAHRTWVEGREIQLTTLEFKLLLTLFDRRDRVQSRDTLLEDVWHMDTEVTARAVDTHMARLREKLGQAGRYIETVRGAGYRFARMAKASTQ